MHSLYAVQHAIKVICHFCGLPVDIWKPGARIEFVSSDDPEEVARGSLKTSMNPLEPRCPACLLLSMSPEEQVEYRPIYDRARKAARAAGVPDCVTVVPLQWDGIPHVRSRAVGYSITCYCALIPGWVEGYAARSAIVVEGYEDGLGRAVSLVMFTIEVDHVDVESAFLRYIFPFYDLSILPLTEIVGGFALPEEDLIKVVKGCCMLTELKRTGGRRTGSTSWSQEEFLDELPRARDRLYERNGKKPTDLEIAGEMGMSPSSFGRYKKACFKAQE